MRLRLGLCSLALITACGSTASNNEIDAQPSGDGGGAGGDGGGAGVDAAVSAQALSAGPDAVDFGALFVSTASLPTLVRVTNIGNAATGTIATTITGTSAGSFSIATDDCNGKPLAPGAGCDLEVAFEPSAAGAASAELVISDSVATATVSLAGVGLTPGALSISPTLHDFGTADVNVASAIQVFTVSNDGGIQTAALTVMPSSGEFVVSSNTCTGTMLAAGATCTLGLALNPNSVGSKIGSLTVSGGTAGSAVASIGGTGQATLTVSKAGDGTGTVTSNPAGINCGGICTAKFTVSTVTLTASAASGSTLFNWSNACSGTNPVCTVTLDAAATAAADFRTNKQLRVLFPVQPAGRVTSAPAGILCNPTCQFLFKHGLSVNLTPQAMNGASFLGWTGACSGTGACTVAMTAARDVNARFQCNKGGCSCNKGVCSCGKAGCF